MTHSLNNTGVRSRTIKINYYDKFLSHEHIFFPPSVDKLVKNKKYNKFLSCLYRDYHEITYG